MREKKSELEIYSGIAILFVVIIHCNAYYIKNINDIKIPIYIEIISNIVDIAVPMFIFIAGYKYYLNNTYDNYNIYCKKKIHKVMKPFLVISILFILKSILIEYENPSALDLIKRMMTIFIGYNDAYQLWYIPMYLFIALSYPIIYKNIKSDTLRYVLIALVIIVYEILSTKFRFLLNHPFDFIYYLIFWEIGVSFAKQEIYSKLRKYEVLIVCIYIVLSIVIPKLSKYIIYPIGAISYYFISMRLKNIKILEVLGKYSFYIYLLHAPTLNTIVCYIFYNIAIISLPIGIMLSSIMVIFISIVLYNVINRTFIKYLIFN